MTDQRILDMLNETGGKHTALVLANYLATLDQRFGKQFDPIRALNDLIETATILRAKFNPPPTSELT